MIYSDNVEYVRDQYGNLRPVPKQPKQKSGLNDLAKLGAAYYLGKKTLGGESVVNAASGGGIQAGIQGISGAGAAGIPAAAPTGIGPIASGEAYAASLGQATPFFSLSHGGLLADGAMPIGNYAPGIAGAYGLYDLYKNREDIGTSKGYAQGALSGAGIGFTIGGPVGAGIGAGLGLLGNAFGIGGKSRTKGEEKLRGSLAEQGIVIPNADKKEWEDNPIFRESRNESDLTGKDIIHAADFYTLPGYAEADAAKQEAIANEALKQGLIEEKLGKINVNMTDAYKAYLEGQLGQNDAAPTSGNSGGGSAGDAKKNRKRAALQALLPMAQTTKAPRYDINVSPLINNPYL